MPRPSRFFAPEGGLGRDAPGFPLRGNDGRVRGNDGRVRG